MTTTAQQAADAIIANMARFKTVARAETVAKPSRHRIVVSLKPAGAYPFAVVQNKQELDLLLAAGRILATWHRRDGRLLSVPVDQLQESEQAGGLALADRFDQPPQSGSDRAAAAELAAADEQTFRQAVESLARRSTDLARIADHLGYGTTSPTIAENVAQILNHSDGIAHEAGRLLAVLANLTRN